MKPGSPSDNYALNAKLRFSVIPVPPSFDRFPFYLSIQYCPNLKVILKSLKETPMADKFY